MIDNKDKIDIDAEEVLAKSIKAKAARDAKVKPDPTEIPLHVTKDTDSDEFKKAPVAATAAHKKDVQARGSDNE